MIFLHNGIIHIVLRALFDLDCGFCLLTKIGEGEHIKYNITLVVYIVNTLDCKVFFLVIKSFLLKTSKIGTL